MIKLLSSSNDLLHRLYSRVLTQPMIFTKRKRELTENFKGMV